MKKTAFYLAFMVSPLMFSCNQTDSRKSGGTSDTLLHEQCYISTFEKDTADLKVKTMSTGKVSGELLIKYDQKPMNKGTFEGTFKGDTLFVDYTFKEGKDTVTIYKNPLAFLKKNENLIMGVGQIETSMGRSYFVKGKPIDFEKGKFTFITKDCK